MKRSIKFLLVAVLSLGSTTLFAQKFGRIDYNGVIEGMPEVATVQEKMQKAQADYQEILDGLQVEINKKIEELQALPETTAESVRQLRQRDIIELQSRYQERLQMAQEGLQQTQMELITPLQEKADAAIKKISKVQGIIVVFQIDQVIYLDEEATIDITAAVKSELGI